MSWADLTAMLAQVAEQPPFILVAVMCAFFAGLLIGLYARAQHEQPGSCAGDTHTHFWRPAPPPGHDNRAQAGPRVRALSAALKPSYDSRKAQPKA